MNNKGFTLVEIIAVIALIAVVMVIITPNIMEILTNSADKAMKVQESEVSEAGLLYLEDHCKNPIEGKKCSNQEKGVDLYQRDNYLYSGWININELVNEKYIEQIEYNGEVCTGYVQIYNNKASTCLECDNKYRTNKDGSCGPR